MSKNKKWLIGTIVLFFVVAFVYFVFINNSNTNNNVEAKTNITLKGNEYLTIEIGNDYEEKGAEALDSDGNDITDKIEITGFVDITKPGIYKITYTIIDSDNNKITKIREVKVIDTIKPTVVFETNGSNIEKQTHQTKVTVEDIGGIDTSSLKYLWSDSQDQPKEEDFFLKFDNDAVISNTETKGIYYLWIIAKDESGNTSIVMSNGFNFNYTPQSSNPTPSPVVSTPEVTLLGSSPVTIEVGSSYVDAGAIADDEKDGVLVPVATTNLNANEIGTYYVTYTATNSAGKQASKTRIINVVDTTIPVITLVGESEITIEVGSSYADAGATASDNYDEDITTDIVIVGTVDTEEIGTYTITYNVTDSSGNKADEVTRTVHVTDTTIPVITLVGESEITIEVGSSYADAGATASDNYDEDITTDIVIVGTVDTEEIGTYTITYNVTDSSGNKADEVTRTVHVTDTTIPVITLVGESEITIEVGSSYADAGATASDNYDEDITTDIVIVGTVDTEEIGTYTITYNVTDSSGNKADEVTRTVHVTDTTIPVITLVGESEITIEVGSSYADAGATASDNYDEDITTDIVIVGTVDTEEIGTYTITYNVTDSSGNKADEVTRTVHVTDTTIPVITLVGESEITIEVGSSYADAGATASDNYDEDITTDIVIVGTVDTEEIGTYTITYNVTDSSGNKADEVTRTVHVTDTTIPVITLVGESEITIEVGSSYADAGATASDNYDEDITTDIVIVGTVDTEEIGTYTITYNVTDSSGNKADEVTRTVHVTDTTIPVITLVGESEITIEVGSSYADAGATASDNYDEDITTDIVIVGTVDTEEIGTYTITYNVTDSSGNKADEVTRTVHVTDTTIPVITLVGESEITIEVGSSYADAGATASDNYDEDITTDIVIVGTVDTEEIGTYTITYNVTDSSGNKADEVTRTVHVTDTTIPVITLVGESEITIEVGSSYADAGATASDNYDEDITTDIVIVGTVDTEEIGTYTITYNVTDSSGNKADEVTRTVHVTDTTIPVITLVGESEITIEVGSSYADAGATASDNYDEDITTDIVIVGTVDTEEIGTYTITYNVTDSSGNKADEVTRTVHVTDTTIPVITLVGESEITIEVGSSYADAGATASDNYDEDITTDIVIVGTVDTEEIGTYTITYNVTDSSGNKADEVTRTVHVTDTTIPVITLVGESEITIEVGSSYADAGATASDNYDEDITTDIVIVGTVDTEEIGTYTITYNVTDSSGNKADEVTRTVHVTDTTIPVITLVGESEITIEVGSSYADAGATASDNYDEDITTDIVIVGTVDTEEIGTYTITYNVTDSSGNKADEVTRTVHVTDTTIPVITLVGESEITIEVGSSYADAGATASDNYDEDITTDIVIVGTVDTEEIGTYTITYNVTDSSGNKADEVTRTVHVTDTTIPVITLVGESEITIEVGSSYADAGATASDNYDEDITTDIVIVGTVDTEEIGTYTITYNVTDSSGNKADEVTRTVHVTDTTIPVITLVGESEITIEVGSSYADAGATASDNYDEDITTDIVIVGTVDTEEIGTYTITYNVTDSSGNKADEVTRTVHVTDTTIPVITLVGESEITIEVGSSYADAGATASDNYDEDITTDIVIVGTVDTEEIGTYTITYNVTDSSGNKADEVTRTVHVTDTTIPVITLVGESEITIEVGSSYADAGATASDNYDEDITTDIVIVGTVDTEEIGTYTITYNVTDSSGNKADEVTRTVHVTDTTIPVITLVGESEITIEVGSSYADAGATASDNYDEDITTDIVIVGTVDTEEIGTYTITYNVTDSSGNKADEVTRTVHVTDTTIPVITLVGESEITIEVGSSYADAGATASDNYDEDITTDIVIVGTVDTEEIGTYTITYNVTDSSGNKADEVTRTVHVTDTTIPVITLVGESEITIEVGSSYADAGATASDNYDEDITTDIVIVGTVDTEEIGTYTITYNVTDSSGNKADEVTRTVHVTDTTIPVITLVGESEITIEVGSSYADAGATASDNYDEDITTDIVIVGTVDTEEIGTYTITYNVTDSSGNKADEVTRTVHVVEPE